MAKKKVMTVDPDTGAMKGGGHRDARFDMVPPEFEWDLARHFGYNSTEHGGQYPPHNWRKGMAWSKHYDSSRAHLNKFWRGEEWDEDELPNKVPHLMAAIWHLVCLYTAWKIGFGTDDRISKGSK